MSKEDLRIISEMFAVSENKQTQRDQARCQLRVDKINREKAEREQFLATNLERLRKTGIVDLFEEIKESELNGKSYSIDFDRNKTSICLIWDRFSSFDDYYYQKSDSFGYKALTGRIDSQGKLFLRKNILILGKGKYKYNGPETLVEDNLVDLVGKKLGENKDTQPQPLKRSFLDRLVGK